eukprot:TRINITY_DN1648_c1_g1_i2.p2 TRINITY_DN1648_c1_g1~~TRINITY_DN1648_c1_g1_i2.p2  ORF type:complete len:106 (-),score=1.99 TRINITY_DN1648_c1_g1_i2:142-459(-)
MLLLNCAHKHGWMNHTTVVALAALCSRADQTQPFCSVRMTLVAWLAHSAVWVQLCTAIIWSHQTRQKDGVDTCHQLSWLAAQPMIGSCCAGIDEQCIAHLRFSRL